MRCLLSYLHQSCGFVKALRCLDFPSTMLLVRVTACLACSLGHKDAGKQTETFSFTRNTLRLLLLVVKVTEMLRPRQVQL